MTTVMAIKNTIIIYRYFSLFIEQYEYDDLSNYYINFTFKTRWAIIAEI